MYYLLRFTLIRTIWHANNETFSSQVSRENGAEPQESLHFYRERPIIQKVAFLKALKI